MGRVISTCIQFIDAFSNPSKQTIANMRKMANEAKAAGKSIQSAGNTIQNAGKSLTKTVTAPIAGVGIAAIKTAADFEAGMSNVGAIIGTVSKKAIPEAIKAAEEVGLSFEKSSDATETAMNILKAQAKELGETTAWSAKEVSEAMQYTGMAGWTAADNVKGLKGILDLASASGTDLARTSDIMTDAISAFGDTAGDSARYADVMTKACTSANVSVDTLGESYKYCAAICGTMNYSVEEITTSLAAMGNKRIKGSQAGTTLKNAISNMAAPTKNMKAAMDDLKISITNQDGSMRSWGDVIKNLQTSFKGLTQDQQAAYAKQLFGKESMAGMLAIINTSTKSYNDLSKSIKESGGAANEAAQTQLDNLNGQLTILKSGLEVAAITIGDKLTPYVKTAVGWVQEATDWFNSLSDAQVTSIMKWAGIAAAIGPCILIFGKVVTGVGKAVSIFGRISGAVAKAGSVMALITSPAGIVIGVLAAIAVAAVLVVKNWDKIKPVIMNVKAWFVDTFGGTIKQAINGFKTVFTAAMNGVKSIMPSVGQFIKNGIAAAMPAVQAIVSALKTMLPAAVGTIKTVIQAILPIIQTIVATLSKILPKAIETVKAVIKSITPVIQTVIGVVVKVAPIIASTFVSVLQKLNPVIKTIGNVIKAVIPVIGKLFSNAFSFVGKTITKIMPSINKIAKTIGGVLVFAIRKVSPVVTKLAGTFSTVFAKVFSVVSGAVKKLQPVFNVIGTIVKTVMNVVGKVIGTTFRTAANVISSAAGSIKRIISGVVKVFDGVIDFVGGVFTGNWSKAWEGVKNIFGGAFEALGGLCKAPINAIIGLINSAINGINSISVDIPEGIPLVGGKHIGFSIPTIPTLAKGTPDWKGGIVQISEKGGEIVDLPKGSRVYPHDQSVQMARKSANGKLAAADRRVASLEKTAADKKGKGDITITIPKLAEQIIVKDTKDIDKIAEEIATKLRDTAINMGVA